MLMLAFVGINIATLATLDKSITTNTETITTMTEANQNFSKVAKVAENNGQAVIFKNNKPKFLLIDVESNSFFDITDDEKIDVAARRILNRFKPAFEELAK